MATQSATKQEGLAGPEKDSGQEETGEKGEESGGKTGGTLSNLLSPEGIMMLLVAIILDLAGLILLCCGLDDFFTLDVIGIAIIGSWILFRSQTLKMTKGTAARMRKKVGKFAPKEISKVTKWGKRLKWLRPLMIFGELIPYVGDAPCWTFLVYAELKA